MLGLHSDSPNMQIPSLRISYRQILVLIAATLVLLVSNGLAIGGLSVFFKDIQADLVATGAVSSSEIQSRFSLGPALTIFLAGFLAPVGGNLLRAIGVRKVMLIGWALLTCAFLIYSQSTTIETIYLAHSILGISLCFCGVVPTSTLVAEWFPTFRGTAMGIALTGTNLGTMVIPMVAVPLIERYHWRSGMLLTGLVFVTGLLLLVLTTVRSVSEIPSQSAGDVSAVPKSSLTQSLLSRNFLLLATCAALLFYSIFAVLQLFVLFLRTDTFGYTLAETAGFLFLLSVSTIAGKFLFGLVSDRLGSASMLVVCIALMAMGTLRLWEPESSTVPTFTVLFGAGYGGAFVMLQRMVADLFGKDEYPRILSGLHFIQTIGGAIGLLTTGYVADLNAGDFVPAFRLLIPVTTGALLCALALRVGLFLRR